MRRVESVVHIKQAENDLYNRTEVRCTILADKASRQGDAPKMTMDRAIEHVQQIDPSYVVELGKKDIPSFLYNSSGKLT
jgi:hypothetical protein